MIVKEMIAYANKLFGSKDVLVAPPADLSCLNKHGPVPKHPWYFGRKRGLKKIEDQQHDDDADADIVASEGNRHRSSLALAKREANDKMEVALDAFDLQLIDDLYRQPVRLLAVSLSLEMKKKGFPAVEDVPGLADWDMNVGVCLSAFNPTVAAWEPLIEPIVSPLNSSSPPWSLNMKMVQTTASASQPLGSQSIAVVSQIPLEITLTNAFLSSLLHSGFLDPDSKAKVRTRDYVNVSPATPHIGDIVVSNYLCTPLHIKACENFESNGELVCVIDGSTCTLSIILLGTPRERSERITAVQQRRNKRQRQI
jgi:hypothetical protein